MRVGREDRGWTRVAGVLASLALLAAGCATAAETASPEASIGTPPVVVVSLPPDSAPTASPTLPLCQDGPNAPSPRPPKCLVPTPRRTPTLEPTSTPSLTRATPTPIDAESQEGTDYFNKTIAAGKTVSVPVDFEGSSWGAIVVYSKSNAVSGTFNGTPLTGAQSALGWGLSLQPKTPVNGTLILKNGGKTAADVSGYVNLLSRRHLVVSLAHVFVMRNTQFAIDVVLTQATDADKVTVAIAGATSSKPIAMTKVGVGHWTGTAAMSEPGTYDIAAGTGGPRMRVRTYPLTIYGDGVKVLSVPPETAVDTNHDGLIDELDFQATVSMDKSGTFDVIGELYNQAGNDFSGNSVESIAFTGNVPRTLTIRVHCDGFYEYRESGPFELRLRVSHFVRPDFVYDAWDLVVRKTAAYSFAEFVH